MKKSELQELIREEVRKVLQSRNVIKEAFASNILRKVTSQSKNDRLNRYLSNKLPAAFKNYTGTAIDKIQDSDFIEMNPIEAYRNLKKAPEKYVVFYYSTKEKTNPYAGQDVYHSDKIIPADTLIAMATGENEFISYFASSYHSSGGANLTKDNKSRYTSNIGMSKDTGKYGSNIYNVKRAAEVSDVAYVLNIKAIQAKYSISDLTSARREAKKNAIAFKTPEQFKADNLARYKEILATRAGSTNIDLLVKDVITKLSTQITDAVTAKTPGRYEKIIIGVNSRGQEVRISDATYLMGKVMDNYNNYARYMDQAAEAKDTGYTWGRDYEKQANQYALEIKKISQKIDKLDYAW
jgi:hypothetical protein